MRQLERDSSIFFAIVAFALMTLTSYGSVCAEETQRPQEDVEQLINKLQAEDFTERERAVKALIDRGESVRARIEAALKRSPSDPDLAMQLKTVLDGIGARKVVDRYDRPKRIDLSVDDVPAAEVLKKLKEHFGWSLSSVDGLEKKVRVSCKQATFFEALEALRKAAGLAYHSKSRVHMVNPDKSAKDLTEMPISLTERGEKGAVNAAIAGPFIMFVEQLNMSIGLKLDPAMGRTDKNVSLNVQGILVSEPGLPHGELEIDKGVLTDAKNRKLKMREVDIDPWRHSRPTDGPRHDQFRFYISDADDIKAPIKWSSEISIKLPLELKTERVKDIQSFEGKSVELPFGVMTIKEVKEKSKQVVYVISKGLDDWQDRYEKHTRFSAFDKKKSKPKQPGIYWLDENGDMVGSSGYSAHGDGVKSTVTRRFQATPKQLAIIYAPREIERKYKFEITGIPLPTMGK